MQYRSCKKTEKMSSTSADTTHIDSRYPKLLSRWRCFFVVVFCFPLIFLICSLLCFIIVIYYFLMISYCAIRLVFRWRNESISRTQILPNRSFHRQFDYIVSSTDCFIGNMSTTSCWLHTMYNYNFIDQC